MSDKEIIALPILLTGLYAVDEIAETATLWLRSHSDQVTTTIVHERAEHHPLSYDLVGSETSEPITVFNRETVTLLCKVEEVVVASGVFQVSLALPGEIDAFLIPCCASMLLLEQSAGSYVSLEDAEALAERITGTLEQIGGQAR